jgi:hypothetical protein
MAIASPEERQKGGAQYLKRTAITEVRGMFFGATFGRGMIGALRSGPKQGIAKPGLTTRGGSDPLFAGIDRRDYGKKLYDHVKGLW